MKTIRKSLKIIKEAVEIKKLMLLPDTIECANYWAWIWPLNRLSRMSDQVPFF